MFFVYYNYITIKTLLIKKNRDKHRKTQTKLKNYRKNPVKTLEEQKKFIDIKYPKTPPFVWSFKNMFKVLVKISISIFIIINIFKLWNNYIGIEFKLWQVFLITIFYPMLINFVLKKFGLERDDLSVYF